jgi:hypothetical protein
VPIPVSAAGAINPESQGIAPELRPTVASGSIPACLSHGVRAFGPMRCVHHQPGSTGRRRHMEQHLGKRHAISGDALASIDTFTVEAEEIGPARGGLDDPYAIDDDEDEAHEDDADDHNDESGSSPPRHKQARYTPADRVENIRAARMAEAQEWVQAMWLEHGTDEEWVWHYLHRYTRFLFARRAKGIGYSASIHTAWENRFFFDLEFNQQDAAQDFLLAMVSAIERGRFRGVDADGKPAPIYNYVNAAFRNNRKRVAIAEADCAYRHEQPVDINDMGDDDSGNMLAEGGPGLSLDSAVEIAQTVTPEKSWRADPRDEDFFPITQPGDPQANDALGRTAARLRELFFYADDPCKRAIARIVLADSREHTFALNETKIARELAAIPACETWNRDKVRRFFAKIRADLKDYYFDPANGRNEELRWQKTDPKYAVANGDGATA